MSFTIPIRRLLALRSQLSDKTVLDYLTVATMAGQPGFVATNVLKDRWRCSQPSVSRRIGKLAASGLIDATTTVGGYHVHAITELEAT